METPKEETVQVKIETTINIRGKEHPVKFSCYVKPDKAAALEKKILKTIKEFEKECNASKKFINLSPIKFPFIDTK